MTSSFECICMLYLANIRYCLWPWASAIISGSSWGLVIFKPLPSTLMPADFRRENGKKKKKPLFHHLFLKVLVNISKYLFNY